MFYVSNNIFILEKNVQIYTNYDHWSSPNFWEIQQTSQSWVQHIHPLYTDSSPCLKQTSIKSMQSTDKNSRQGISYSRYYYSI